MTAMANGNRVEQFVAASPTNRVPSGRTIPHSVDAEMGVLGSMMASPKLAILETMEKLTPEHFFVPAHQTVYGELVAAFEDGGAIDPVTFTQRLSDRNLLDSVGGMIAVTGLFTFVPTAANLEYYVEIVREKFTLRQLITAATEIVRRAYDEQDALDALVDDAQAKMTGIALDQSVESPVKQVFSAVEAALEEIENARKKRGTTTGLSTGFTDLDRTTLGFGEGEMIILAARPSMGKTSLAMRIARNVAFDHREAGHDVKGKPVLVFSIETGAKRLMFRNICSETRVNIQDLRRGHAAEPEIDAIREFAPRLAHAPIYIDETPSIRTFEFKARARQAVARYGVALIIIDYLQLIKSPSKRAEFSKTLEITEVSVAIKEIARSLNVPVLALAQLNREVENRSKARPRMSDLRESGQLEQDADMILLLHREDYYLPEGSPERAAAEGKATLIVAKQKDGPTAELELAFEKEFARFDNLTAKLYSSNPAERQANRQGEL